MKCVCGHHRVNHVHSGWPHFANYCNAFTCCNRSPETGIGRGGGEHDFVTHQVQRCACKEFVQQQDERGNNA